MSCGYFLNTALIAEQMETSFHQTRGAGVPALLSFPLYCKIFFFPKQAMNLSVSGLFQAGS